MANKALLDVLQQTIGKYVRGLDAESLNVAVWSGKIELNSLQLDCDSVNAELARQAAEAPNLAIPFKVVSGEFEHFQVDVPWAKIMFRPVILRAHGLRITVEPHNQTATADYLNIVHDSEAARARKVEEQRNNSIELADEYRKQANTLRDLAAQDLESSLNKSSQSSSNNANSTFAARLVRRIIENIQVEITDVKVIVQGSDCSAGVTLDSLSLVTTDQDGKPTFVDRNAGSTAGIDMAFLFKALQITGLGIYLDEDESKMTHLAPIGENAEKEPLDHSYVLAPLSFEAKLRQADSNKCIDYPKYLLASELSSLSVMLSKTQVELASKIAEQIHPSVDVAKPLFPEYRPLKRVTRETAVIWWKYAVRCVGRLNGRRSWVEFFRAFQLRKAYIPLYKRHAHHEKCPWIKALASWEVLQLRGIEKDRSISVDGIMVWRNIADAQVKKEQEKHDASQAKAKGSIFSSLFGSPQTDGKSGENDPPISLSVEELQALEKFTTAQVADSELSADSLLCDVKFVLGSLRINLSSFDRPVTSLEMGSVSTSFDANQDGSYSFDLALTSLEVQDRVTPKSFFPTILKNQPGATTGDADKAFRVRCSKNRSGDQQVQVKLSTFEAVASPTLLVELKQFVTLSKHRPGTSKSAKANPLLAQSLSGSVDLFYDASEGSDRKEDHVLVPSQEMASSAAMGDISNALIDAWRSKTESKASWIVDLDIQAPIVVVPENCTSPRANVLVFDLGHLRFQYGKVDDASPKVEDWYRTNRRSGSRVEPVLDKGSVRISSLTFTLGKANYWRRMVRKHESSGSPNDDEAIIDPISLSVDFGVEIAVGQVPRLCAIGILPSIVMRLSPNQLVRILQVSNAWQNRLKEVFPEEEVLGNGADNVASASSLQTASQSFEAPIPVEATLALASEKALPVLYAEIRLQKLSIQVLDDAGNGIEGHLISVSATTSRLADGSSCSSLAMGWFWILDRFENDFPRIQRLIAHSTLPLSPEEFAREEKYDVLGELRSRGVFEDAFEGSVDLADITFKQSAPGTKLGNIDPFVSEQLNNVELAVSSILDARFTRLFLTWNPRAVKTMTSMLGKFAESARPNDAESEGMIVSSPAQLLRRRRLSIDSLRSKTEVTAAGSGTMWIKATMDGLQVSLNSARDDLPLFTGTMASTQLSVVSDEDQNTRLTLVVGELKIASPAMGRTQPMYRTILGLAPGKSDSLLSVRYYAGSKSLASVSSTGTDLSDCEAYGEVELSPMRMVYIQAQVLALVEYATAGILGAMTAQAASSAANAAAELAATNDSKKVFTVRARSFDLILPQAAYKTSYISASLGSLLVDFTMMPDSSAAVRISLCDVLMRDTLSEQLLQEPVRMDITVSLGPEGVGTKEDQAMNVNIAISKANFVLSKPQYAQLLATLDENVGEEDICLREDSVPVMDEAEGGSVSEGQSLFPGLTHAGVETVVDPRRLYLHITISAVALSLCGVDKDEPLIRLSAVDAVVDFKSLVDCGKMSSQVTLRDLACDDQRWKSSSRQYRSLIYQPSQSGDSSEGIDEVFFASYETSEDESSSIELKVGSPRIVFIPDVVSDVLKYLNVERKSDRRDTSKVLQTVSYREVVAVDAGGSDSGIEACFVHEREASMISSLTFAMKTSQCSVLLVDLGSDSLRQRGSSVLSVASVAETIVLGGVFEAKLSMETDKETNSVVKMDAQFHGDGIEAYTAFGRDLHSAVQVLDPTQFSLYVNSKSVTGKSQAVDVRCAVISPVDITLSMRNVALMNAIMTSVSDCFEEPESEHDSKMHSLSRQEADRIEQLARALETESSESIHSQDLKLADEDSTVAASKPKSDAEIQSESSFKLTTPEVRLTLVNDLQGLDEALLRLTIRNIVANGRMQAEVRTNKDAPPFTGFDFNFHTSILADYFDASTNMWKVLLLHPWEVSSKGNRGPSRRFQSNRPSTTVDVDSLPCHLSFSEQFLMSLASANRMWSVYSAASSSALESLDQASQESKSLRRSMAASAARTFISSLPYAVENHAGITIELIINGEKQERRTCASGSIEYFIFEPPTGKGSGGKRLYGQDVTFDKTVSLLIGSHHVDLPHLDSQLGQPKRSHALGNHRVIMTDVVKEGKTTVVHVSSGVDIHNRSSIPFAITMFKNGTPYEVGTCNGMSFQSCLGQPNAKRSLVVQDGKVSKPSSRFGIPVDLIETFRADYAQKKDAMIALSFSPKIECRHEGWLFSGGTKLKMNDSVFSGSLSGTVTKRFEITCRPVSQNGAAEGNVPRDLYAFVLHACVSMTLVEGKDPSIDIFIEPRALITNKMPISITVQTPMPHIFSCSSLTPLPGEESIHGIEQNGQIQIFTSGPSIAISVKCSDLPVGGTATDWIDGGWIDLPLVSEFRIQEPLECMFPFVRKTMDPLALNGARGSDFVIAQGSTSITNLSSVSSNAGGSTSTHNDAVELSAPSVDEDWSTFFVTVRNYAVDHTGDILFEQMVASSRATLRRSSTGVEASKTSRATQVSPAIGAYATGFHRGRISLLPESIVPIRLLHLSMEGEEGLRRSSPFQIEDISICEGGIDSTPVKWEDGTLSGFFAYRKLVSSSQSEVHVVPEYVVFNGSETHRVCVSQPGGPGLMIDPGKLAPLRTHAHETAVITVEFPELGGQTRPLRIDSLGLRVAVVKSRDGFLMGSFAIQTVAGARDSRLVVKLGGIKCGSLGAPGEANSSPYDLLRDDFLRFRVKWSELQMTLNEARPLSEGSPAIFESAFDRIQKASTPAKSGRLMCASGDSSSKSETWVEARERYKLDQHRDRKHDTDDAVCTILFDRFTVDWQRVFKDDDLSQLRSAREALEANFERSQLAVVIHHVQIRDETADSPFPVVFDSISQQVEFLNLCIRFRGEINSDMVTTIDMLQLDLAHANGISEKIILNTSEDFVWKVLDLANRILVAAAEFAGVDIQLNWDDEHDGYVVAIREKTSSYLEEETKYSPPTSDMIYHIKKTRVSPFTVVVSFKRNPQSSRYKLLRGFKGAYVMNYFTRRLKFKIQNAELCFARYEASDVKGPPDHIVELISTVYLSRMKTKVLTILTAASFQDWKFLASREGGEDAFKEGDILRATGNVAGSTADYLFQQAGKGLGSGVRNVASSLGGGIESATDAIGVRALGAGVNSVVSGVGDGVGSTISGVGSGAGKVFKSVGQGAGQAVGGFTGGILLVGKGLGKGITTGDGRAVASGLVQGGTALGAGVGQGLESVVTGTADGVLSVGKGLFSGVRSVGKGIGGAFKECCGCFSCCCTESEEVSQTGVYSPLLPRRNDTEDTEEQ